MSPLEYRHVTIFQGRGRLPQRQRAPSGAERQRAIDNATPRTNRTVSRRPRRVPRPPTRPQRWRAAVAELAALQAEYAAWLDALPEALRKDATGEALQTIVDLDIDELIAIEPPRGCGRD